MEDKVEGACDMYAGEQTRVAVFGRENWPLGWLWHRWDDNMQTDIVKAAVSL